jgi:hypothetical protein
MRRVSAVGDEGNDPHWVPTAAGTAGGRLESSVQQAGPIPGSGFRTLRYTAAMSSPRATDYCEQWLGVGGDVAEKRLIARVRAGAIGERRGFGRCVVRLVLLTYSPDIVTRRIQPIPTSTEKGPRRRPFFYWGIAPSPASVRATTLPTFLAQASQCIDARRLAGANRGSGTRNSYVDCCTRRLN